MIIENINQDTPEWHDFRSKGIGSSDIGVIMGLNKYKTIKKLWQEKTGLVAESFEENEYTKYGKHKEKYALAEYEWQYGVSGFRPCLFIHDKYSFVRSSYDAFHIPNKYGLEIKSPYFPKNIKHAADGKIDRKYYAQLQWLMLGSGSKMIKYVVYDGSTKLWVKDVYEDVKYQRRMLRYAAWFWNLVEKKIDPKRSKPRFIAIDNKDVTE